MIIIKESKDIHKYRVWYNPYLLDNEEDYIEVEATNEDEARRKSNKKYVTEIELIDNLNESNDDTITINDIVLSDLEKFITKKLDDNSLWVDNIEVYEEDGSICINITINWGDWKHEHKRLDYLMFDIIYEYNPKLASNYYKEDEVITNEDGSDNYSAIHKYRIVIDEKPIQTYFD